jgi:ATP-dependent DNA helicase RecG
MLIEQADRFGLSQLHQLRGRIGRGVAAGPKAEARCLLFFSAAPTPEAQARLKAVAKTHDGFKIAEEDFRLRGPGEFFGTRQHGLPEFVVADLLADAKLLAEARRDAFALVAADPELARPEHAPLAARARRVFAGRLDLGGTA